MTEEIIDEYEHAKLGDYRGEMRDGMIKIFRISDDEEIADIPVDGASDIASVLLAFTSQ